MRIIISPAKKMKVDTENLLWKDLPVFLPKTQQLFDSLREMSYDELKKLWKCNDSIAELNSKRLEHLDLYNQLTPAVVAYEGIQYQYMAPGVFSDREFAYIQEHLRILSGFYGILKPFDGVSPYRLEMQAKLRVGESKDLYEFWGSSIAACLLAESKCIVNLASKEYSACITKHLSGGVHFINFIFGEEKDGKVIEKGTMCKMARGEMVRYMAEEQITDPEKTKNFNRLNFHYSTAHSDSNKFVFLKDATSS